MLKNTNNSISIIIPHKNDSNIISRALDSIVIQTFKPYQVIVVDDNSTPEQKSNLISQITKYKQLPIKLSDSNGSGLAAARNTGIWEANGSLLAFLDCDDEWLPNKLALQVDVFEANVIAVHGWCINIDMQKHETLLKPKVKYCQKCLMDGSYSVTGSASSIMMKSEIALKVNGFNEKLKFGEDLDMWVRISDYGIIRCIELPLVKIAVRSDGMQETLVSDPKLKSNAHQIMIQNWLKAGFITKKTGNKILADRIISIASEYMKITSHYRVLAYLLKPIDKNNDSDINISYWNLLLALFLKIRD